ncbi:13530_t:CDS:2, partial [Acaulospora morrowiae]
KIKEITGNENVGFDEIDLEEDFDPDKYDEKMHKVFGNDYYDQEVDSEKPEWGDDIDIGDLVSGNNVVKAIEEDDFIMDADYLPGGERYDETKADLTKSEKKKLEREEKKKVKRKFDEYLDEYYQLDYEDIIGDTPVRFKYRQTKPLSFGLTPAEMLISDEKELNEYVSIKKLAPFRPEHLVENDVKKYSKKKRLQQFRKKLELLEADNPPEDKAWSIKAFKRKKQEAQNLSVKKKKNLQDEHDTSSKRKKKKKTREATAA